METRKQALDAGRKDLETSEADENRIARDYAFMRLEHIERSDLKGVTEGELIALAAEFHTAQKALLVSLGSVSDRTSEFQNTVKFDKKLHSIIDKLHASQSECKVVPQVNTTVNNVSNLPKISIRPFDGRQENWVSFKHLFDSLIHKKEMPSVEKMHYLLTSVQGEAYNLIKGYPITDENYLLAYKALLKRYDGKRSIAFTYYNKLLECAKSRSASDLGRICRTFSENLDILSRYDLPDRNFMLFQLLWSKLDSTTREAYDMQTDVTVDIPLYEDLLLFVEKKARAMGNSVDKQSSQSKVVSVKNKTTLVVTNEECSICGNVGHPVEKCSKFMEKSPKERYEIAKEKGLCLLCLQPSHTIKFCRSKTKCTKCHKNSHHTLLHFEKNPQEPSASTSDIALAAYSLCRQTMSESLFATAEALVKNKVGKLVPVRLLFDSASARNFISKACAHRLGLDFTKHGHSVTGIGEVSTKTLGSVELELVPKDREVKNAVSLEVSVLPKICSDMPVGVVDVSKWHHLKNLNLADPHFYKPGPVDILVSVNVFTSTLKPGFLSGSAGQPVALSTIFGWIVMGECSILDEPKNKNCFVVSNLTLDNSIKRFWELEKVDPPRAVVRSKVEVECEAYMEKSLVKTPEGRFVVPLTFEDPNKRPTFRCSREIALKRFLNLEKKFRVNSTFRTAYVEFMRDYLEKGHMERVDPPSSSVGSFYYIPHHGVLRPGSMTTPLRTVFDASAKDWDGRALNDTLLPGPKLQNSIFDLLVRFRWHAVVFTGDIKQMYRQFLVSPEDTEYQRILWRSSPELPLEDFRLVTVTYGVSCAPYQALWCLARLAKEFADRAPLGAAVLQRDSYVDDVVSGAESVKDATAIRDDLLRILSSAGLHLRKWTSNCQEFFEGLPKSDLYAEQFHNFEDIQDVSLKILGMMWLPSDDQLTFKTAAVHSRCTKRSILSDIARIFDPLGLLSPAVFLAKYFMQLLWLSGVGWDDEAPVDIANEWLKFKSQLSSLSGISLHRRVIPSSFVSLQFHGFCDASERGYCAVVYCRAICETQTIVVRLCCAKSKVAPLRKRSIPRLELMAAVLLAELMSSVAHSLEGIHRVENIVAWSDSSVALTWIKSCPSRWKTFVANRVTEVQDNIPPDCWRHVSTTDNPADHGSRGLLPNDLTSCESWWSGPSWLSRPEETWPQPGFAIDNLALDEQKILSLFTANNIDFVGEILARHSSFHKIVNILAWCLRAKHNFRSQNTRIVGPLSSSESNAATLFLVRHVQESVFGSEVRALANGCPNKVPKTLRKLCPFVDPQGLLRVGGRLAHSKLGYDQKHPLLLPRNHRLTSLIIEEYHRKFLHPGLQTLQNLLIQDFWILSPKRAIRTVLSSCIRCFRVKPRLSAAPLMGDLPAYRINQLKPFSSSAVDYAGPFDIALSRGRGVRTFKGYVCVFVCTATKAVHLELASELTSEAYLACLRRFMARRGRCSQLVSDQGRNFVGANNLLKDLMSQAAATERIDFLFNPPGSPHFSGLVEAGVKSMKTHLSRVVGSQRLTYEEFSTLLAQIEALLNSRPLSPLSSDPNDLTVLTPGHFLTMEPLTLLPETSLLDTSVSVLQRWKMLQKMHQDFWRKWHVEYIHTLQQRQKWTNSRPNLEVGMLVLIVNEQCHPMKWKLGRIVKLHLGADNVCRVATIRTAAGECKRPIVKLCPLPIPIVEDKPVVSAGSQ